MTVPLSLTGKYQLLVFGHEGDVRVANCAARLEGALLAAFNQLGVNPRKFLVRVMPGTADFDLDPKMLSIGVFFGFAPNPSLSAPDADRLEWLLRDGLLVVPVVEDIARFTILVPPPMAHLNGCSIVDCGSDFERLASRVLEGYGLLREKRRLFISYRRIDTSGVAAQLYEALDAAGFDVFLDTHGVIRPGEQFQEILWHRLADTDVAVLLDSPGFLASRWTEEELARANSSNIQMLQVLWPGRTEGATAAFSAFHPLESADFVGADTLGPTALLQDNCVREIVDEVEGLRARAIGARQAFLVREFVAEARRVGLTVHMTLERALVVSLPGGGSVLVQPAIGVPDAERYESLDRIRQRDINLGRTYSYPPVLLYDQTGIPTRWVSHLEWLNSNLTCARSVSLPKARGWLDELLKVGAR
jgi:hypothetical protein